MKKAAIYVRVSTSKQANEGYSLGAQEEILKKFVKDRGWNVHRIYRDEGVSGGSIRRDAFLKLLSAAERKMFDVVVVYKLDRFSRSLKDLIETLNRLKSWNVDFISYTENIDTSTAMGKMIFHITGAFAEFERDLISERTKVGMAEAKRQGKHVGRPRKK